jgi:hypothetical protein
MISEITKSFAKAFLVGHLLPAILFVAFAKFAVGYAGSTGLVVFFKNLSEANNLVDLGVFGLILGLLLSTLNREIIRVFEGYGTINPFKLRQFIPCSYLNEKRRFLRLDKRIETLSDLVTQPGATADTWTELGTLQTRFASDFPEKERQVLATRFGNTIRAFERYSSVAYKFTAIEGTNRLNAFIDETTREDVAWAKSKVDFWVNISVLSLLAVLVWIFFGPSPAAAAAPLALPAGLLVAFGAIKLARHAAYEWGVSVKSSIDLALPKLAEGLGYDLPVEANRQQMFWSRLSQHFLLRDATTLHDLEEFRKKPADDGKPAQKAVPKRFVPRRVRRPRHR